MGVCKFSCPLLHMSAHDFSHLVIMWTRWCVFFVFCGTANQSARIQLGQRNQITPRGIIAKLTFYHELLAELFSGELALPE